MGYAEDTSVSVEKSRAEIEKILQRYGAGRFAYMTGEDRAMIGFELKGKLVRFVLPLPQRSEKRFWETPETRKRRTGQQAYEHWERACRQRWRALALCIKAKLEAIQSGITTFEHEFLAHFVMPNGKQFGEIAIPQIEQAVERGEMPKLMLTM